jgi:hypothetical protein
LKDIFLALALFPLLFVKEYLVIYVGVANAGVLTGSSYEPQHTK